MLNAWYRLYCRRPRENRILFLSRQSNSLSTDFALLSREAQYVGGWEIEQRIKMVKGGLSGAAELVARMFGDVRALARCRLCFVEGYNPALSLLDMECDIAGDASCAVKSTQEEAANIATAGDASYTNGKSTDTPSRTTPNSRFPRQPIVMQVWHAAGHFKNFGFEALGTPEGRSREDARIFHMHANYSWIACSGDGAREGFAEAFGYPAERVVPLGHPSFDELYDAPDASLARAYAAYPWLKDCDKPVIVYAPTLKRKNGDDLFEKLKEDLEQDPRSQNYAFIWSLHPVNIEGTSIRATTRDFLRCASLLVTDYSSIVYDAALLDLPFAFYVPDIDEYRTSPGLATDPEKLSPGLCVESAQGLLDFLESSFQGGAHAQNYPTAERDAFVGTTLSACKPGSTERILDFALARVAEAKTQ